MPWDKKPVKESQVYATVGSVACYRFKVTKEGGNEDGSWVFTKWWVKSYGVQTGSLFWSANEDTLYVGFDDGSIERLKIQDNGMYTEVSFHFD